MGGKGSGLEEGFWSVVHWQAPLVKNHYKNGTYWVKLNWKAPNRTLQTSQFRKKKLLSPWHQSAYTGLAD